MDEDESNNQREPAIWLRPDPAGVTSLTKLGGLPNLLSDAEWPRQHETGSPLHFLAQIDLSRLPPTPFAPNRPALAKSGVLYFFADMIEEMRWGEGGSRQSSTRVVHAEQAGPERSPPEDLPDILHAYGEKAGGYNTGVSVYPQVFLNAHVIETFSGLYPPPFVPDASGQSARAAMIASIERAIGMSLPVLSLTNFDETKPHEHLQEYRRPDGGMRYELNCPMHQMLGFGTNLQGTAEVAHADGDILLLQIDTDLAVHEHFMFCDMGIAQFWIRPDDLAAKRFEKAWATTEGG